MTPTPSHLVSLPLGLLLFLANGFGEENWNQWGGNSYRNPTAHQQKPPVDWEVQYKKGNSSEVSTAASKHIAWGRKLYATGSHRSMHTAPPAVANGKVFVGSNNEYEYLSKDKGMDLAVMLCFSDQDGAFLWQHGSKRLEAGKIHDWEFLSVCSTPYVEGERLWYVDNRCQVICLDTEGFYDDENDGITTESRSDKTDADVIWKFDMLGTLKVNPHNFTTSSVTCHGDLIYISTGNGVTYDHKTLPSPDAPSFIALNKHTGELAWKNNTPGKNILHGSWSSPACGEINGHTQVVFAGGDGWIYSFTPTGELIWKYDCNPKKSTYLLGRNDKGDGARNNIVGFPVIHKNCVYVATGQEPEHGKGPAILHCIKPKNRTGDLSPELVYNLAAPDKVIAPKRYQSCNTEAGDFTRKNPNSALKWSYDLQRCCGSPAIAQDLLVIGDVTGNIHCLDAHTGVLHWQHQMVASTLASPLIAGDHIYIGNEDGELLTFRLSSQSSAATPIRTRDFRSPIYAPMIAANDCLYLLTYNDLIKIQ